jgi:hypothetical protein
MNIDFTAIAPVIEGIAQKLGVAAEHLWGVMIRQNYVEGITGMIWGGIWLILAVVIGFIAKHIYKIAIDKDDDDYQFTCMFWGSIVVLLLLVISCTVFTASIKQFINPEYYAFMNIINSFKTK